jgi:cell wall-associated NlpC family hydrolase
MLTAANFVGQARSWLGVPWVHQGRSRAGVDCVGLLVCAARELGLAAGAVDVQDYARQPHGGRLREMAEQHLVPSGYPLQPGHVVLMRFDGEEQHIGLIGDYPAGLSLIHAHSRLGSVVEHRLADVWAQRIMSIYRVPGLEVVP